MIPKNLEACLSVMTKDTPGYTLKEWSGELEEVAIAKVHLTSGMNMRNNWNLWGENKLTKWFNNMGVYHADDMSGIIYTSLHRKLNNKDIDIEGQIEEYRKHWKKFGCNMKGEPVK